jgi:hypothetical protein
MFLLVFPSSLGVSPFTGSHLGYTTGGGGQPEKNMVDLAGGPMISQAMTNSAPSSDHHAGPGGYSSQTSNQFGPYSGETRPPPGMDLIMVDPPPAYEGSNR